MEGNIWHHMFSLPNKCRHEIKNEVTKRYTYPKYIERGPTLIGKNYKVKLIYVTNCKYKSKTKITFEKPSLILASTL